MLHSLYYSAHCIINKFYNFIAVPGIDFMISHTVTRLSASAYDITLNPDRPPGSTTIPVKFHIYYNTTLSTPEQHGHFNTRATNFTILPPVIGDIYRIKFKVELIAESPFGIFGMDIELFDFPTSKYM